MIDTCQANTMYSKFYSPGVLATGSSGKDENSYSVGRIRSSNVRILFLQAESCQCAQHHSDPDLGVAVIDRYTHVILNYLEGINKTSPATLQDLFDEYSFEHFHSNAGIRRDLYPRDASQVKLTEFFGGVSEVEVRDEGLDGRAAARDSDAFGAGLPQEALSVPSQARPPRSRRRSTVTDEILTQEKPRSTSVVSYTSCAALLVVGHVLLALAAMHGRTAGRTKSKAE